MTTFANAGDAFLETPAQPRTSVLAVASFVSSMVCCIPVLTGLFGAFLGVIALFLIGGSHGRLKGRGFAFAGVVLGLLTSMLWIGMIVGATRAFGMYSNAGTATFEAIDAGDVSETRIRFLPALDGAVSDEQIIVFGQMVRDDYGGFVSGPRSLLEYMTEISKTGHTGFNAGEMPIGLTYEQGTMLAYMLMPDATSRPDRSEQFIRDLGYQRPDGTMVWLSDIDVGGDGGPSADDPDR